MTEVYVDVPLSEEGESPSFPVQEVPVEVRSAFAGAKERDGVVELTTSRGDTLYLNVDKICGWI